MKSMRAAAHLVWVGILISGLVVTSCAPPPPDDEVYEITISSTEGGQVIEPGEGSFTYPAGTVVELVAEAEEGYQFVSWTASAGGLGDAGAAETTFTTPAQAATVTVSFVEPLAAVWNGNAIFVPHVQQFSPMGMHFLSVWKEDSVYWVYHIRTYQMHGTHRWATGLATTTDGIVFDDLGIVMDRGSASQFDDRIASFPGVWRDSEAWHLVYEGAGTSEDWPGDIGLATSIDGVNWMKDAHNPILVHDDYGWESVNIGTPSLWKEEDTWYLFYHGFDGTRCRIGVATGPDLHSLEKYSGNPILDVGQSGSWDSGTAGKRSIVKEGDWYYMVYEGSTDMPYETAQWSSGLARSTDLLNWEKFHDNPILPQTAMGFGYDGPEWFCTPDGVWHIYFRGTAGPTQRATWTPAGH